MFILLARCSVLDAEFVFSEHSADVEKLLFAVLLLVDAR